VIAHVRGYSLFEEVSAVPAAPLRPRKAPRQQRAVDTRRRLLDAAAHVFAEFGYARGTTNRIAEAAGHSIGSLYQYFPSKEALVAAVMDRHTQEISEVTRKALVKAAALPIEAAAREFVSVAIDGHRVNPKLHGVLAEQIPHVGRLENIEANVREGYALVRGYLEAHRDEIDVAAGMERETLPAGRDVPRLQILVLRRECDGARGIEGEAIQFGRQRNAADAGFAAHTPNIEKGLVGGLIGLECQQPAFSRRAQQAVEDTGANRPRSRRTRDDSSAQRQGKDESEQTAFRLQTTVWRFDSRISDGVAHAGGSPVAANNRASHC